VIHGLAFNGGPTKTRAPWLNSSALDAGSDALLLTRPDRVTKTTYDDHGRTLTTTQIIGFDDASTSETDDITTTYAYNDLAQLTTVTDPLSHSTTYTYDNLGRKLTETNAESGATSYEYDVSGRMTSLTDPESNTTTWAFGLTGAVYTETIVTAPGTAFLSFEIMSAKIMPAV
jgi:YD repeat-containing protein